MLTPKKTEGELSLILASWEEGCLLRWTPHNLPDGIRSSKVVSRHDTQKEVAEKLREFALRLDPLE